MLEIKQVIKGKMAFHFSLVRTLYGLLLRPFERITGRSCSISFSCTGFNSRAAALLTKLTFLFVDYLEASDSMLIGIMMRFRTLSATNQTLVQMLSDQSDQVRLLLAIMSQYAVYTL